MDQINDLRKELDEIDDTIMSLLDKRYRITTKIGELKKHSNKEVLDQNRENFILEKTSNYSHSPQIESVYKTIMSESRLLQRK